jgi:hypothetical protein
MSRTAFCCVALLAACGFEGSDGSDEPVSAGPPVGPLPAGNLVVSGSISPGTVGGEFYAALLPAGTTLPAELPCLPEGARSTFVDGVARTFSFEAVGAGQYELAVLHFTPDRFHLERTMQAVTVGTTSIDVGGIALPMPLTARSEDSFGPSRGPGGDDKITWTAPSGFEGLAFDMKNKTDICKTGPVLSVSGAYEVAARDSRALKLVVQSAATRQLAAHLLF